MVGLNKTLEPNREPTAWVPKCKGILTREPMEDRLYHQQEYSQTIVRQIDITS
jgi:hypothetical protein